MEGVALSYNPFYNLDSFHEIRYSLDKLRPIFECQIGDRFYQNHFVVMHWDLTRRV